MNRNSFNIFIGILVTFVILGFILKLVPYFIIAGIIVWIGSKIYVFINKKKFSRKNANNSFETMKSSKIDDNLDTSEAIDVDYKDV